MTLICKIDWMNIDYEDRTFVYDLIDRLKEYEQDTSSNSEETEETMEEEEEQ